LSWLAAAESTLQDVEDSAALSGTIEGWNLPAIAPGSTANSALIAVPIESGVGQVFLGWSALVPASMGGFETPLMPKKVGGLVSPGGGASGLNKSTVLNALKDYRRVNPFVSTLTLDLAAAHPTPRLRELDEAIIANLSGWNSDGSETLAGGMRIWDSINRSGSAPLLEAIDSHTASPSAPMAWIRYKHSNVTTKKCNIRFLQESGVRIEVDSGINPGRHENRGVSTGYPLRRFEAFTSETARYSVNAPALAFNSSFSAYQRALVALESPDNTTPLIKSELFKALLVDENADWTVSGEALVSPSSVANLLSNSGDNKMLWEWRPPIFDVSQDIALEKRPYVSVARIPNTFKSRIMSRLSKAYDRSCTPDEADLVLTNLGRRGVGLSSLMAMGETHNAGALGFHITLTMLDAFSTRERPTLVLPIDACYSFLSLLAGSDATKNATKRADLLVLSFDGESMVLTPVEIKFYGLDSAGLSPAKLPDENDSLAKSAKLQAVESNKLLEGIRGKYNSLVESGSEAERNLWLNAFASFFETAVKIGNLGADFSTVVSQMLDSILEGSAALSTGRPIVALFTSNATGDSGVKEIARILEESPDSGTGEAWGLYSTNTQEAFRRLEGSTFTPSEELLKVINFCISGQLTEPDQPATPTTEPDQPATPTTEPDQPATPTTEPDQPATPTTEPVKTWQSRWAKDQGVRITVGNVAGSIGDAVADFWPGNTALNQMNVGVVGDLGTGKTQFLKSFVTQVRDSAKRTQETPVNFLIFDYKRDYSDEAFLERVGGRVLSPKKGIPLNVLSISGEYSKVKAHRKARSFADLLMKIYTGMGPIQREKLSNTIVELFEGSLDHSAPTLTQVRDRYLANSNNRIDAMVSVLNGFINPGVFDERPESVQDFASLINDGVMVVALNEFEANANDKNALVFMLLDLYYAYMQNATKWPFRGENPQIRTVNSFLLVDEATNIMRYDFEILMSLMLEGREFGFGTILASQYLSHFKTKYKNYVEPLSSWVIHKVPNVKVQELSQIGLSTADEATVAQISNLEVHEAIYESFGHKKTWIKGLPFFSL
jgi:hypothetical protein